MNQESGSTVLPKCMLEVYIFCSIAIEKVRQKLNPHINIYKCRINGEYMPEKPINWICMGLGSYPCTRNK